MGGAPSNVHLEACTIARKSTQIRCKRTRAETPVATYRPLSIHSPERRRVGGYALDLRERNPLAYGAATASSTGAE